MTYPSGDYFASEMQRRAEQQAEDRRMPSNMPATEAMAQKRVVLSDEEADNLYKALHVLAGRTEELRERLSGVLTPSIPAGSTDAKTPAPPTGSPLTERFRSMRGVAESANHVINDILLRLDV